VRIRVPEATLAALRDRFPDAVFAAADDRESLAVERNLAPAIVERGIAVTPIAEHGLALMLSFCRNLHVASRLQRERRWDRPAVMTATGTPIRHLAGSRVAVLERARDLFTDNLERFRAGLPLRNRVDPARLCEKLTTSTA
jgi:hypothetical protein